MRLWTWICLAGLTTLLAACSSNDDEVAVDTYESTTGDCAILRQGDYYLGGLFPYGEVWPDGQYWDIAVGIALDEINGSANAFKDGNRLGIISCDSGCGAEQAKLVADELLGSETTAQGFDIQFILGPGCSGAAANLMPDIKAGQRPFVSPSSESGSLTDADDGDNYFRLVLSAARVAAVHARYLHNVMGLSRMAVVYDDDSEFAINSTDVASAAFEAESGTVIDVPYVHTEANPVTPATVVSQLDVANGPDVVFLGDATTETAQIVKEIVAHTWVNVTRPQVEVASGAVNDDYINVINNDAAIEGFGGFEPRVLDSTLRSRVLGAIEQANGGPTGSSYVDKVYDGIYMGAMSLYAASDLTNGVAVRDALRNSTGTGDAVEPGDWAAITTELDSAGSVDYTGVSGPADFDGNGDVSGYYHRWTFQAGAKHYATVDNCFDDTLNDCPTN